MVRRYRSCYRLNLPSRPVGGEQYVNYLGTPIPYKYLTKDWTGEWVDARDKPVYPTFVDFGGSPGKEWD